MLSFFSPSFFTHPLTTDAVEFQIDRLLKQVAELKSADIEKTALVAQHRAKVMEAEKTRRRLHNMVMDLRGNIRVGCRVRPHLGGAGGNAEGNYSFPDALVEQRSVQLTMAPRRSLSGGKGKGKGKTHSFQFDRVFGPQATQADVYEEISQMVQSAVDGYNVCIFAYGQTGSGKTHTMLGAEAQQQGEVGSSATNAPMFELEGENAGMMPRAANHVFAYMTEMHDQGWQFEAEATMVEIYCETIRDLLNVPDGAKEGPVCELRKVRSRDEKTGAIKLNTRVEGITSTPVGSAADILQILHKAVRTRATAETKCNARSSRSHTVFTLKIRGFDTNETFVNGQTKPTMREGQLHLIDLAGSERLDRSGSASDKKLLREAQSINKSLSCLGNVIGAIANKAAHVPFRDSKLTQLLENSLAGDSKALMFCNLSPVEVSLNESLCSLWFAEKVNKCERK
jgi:kinesin family protein C1